MLAAQLLDALGLLLHQDFVLLPRDRQSQVVGREPHFHVRAYVREQRHHALQVLHRRGQLHRGLPRGAAPLQRALELLLQPPALLVALAPERLEVRLRAELELHVLDAPFDEAVHQLLQRLQRVLAAHHHVPALAVLARALDAQVDVAAHLVENSAVVQQLGVDVVPEDLRAHGAEDLLELLLDPLELAVEGPHHRELDVVVRAREGHVRVHLGALLGLVLLTGDQAVDVAADQLPEEVVQGPLRLGLAEL